MGSSNEILDIFLYETNTLLEQLDSIMLAAEANNTFSQDEINEIFRSMHTIKGSCAMMEYNSMMTVAHRIEDLFFIIREKSMDTVPQQDRPLLFDLMFHSIDYFREEVTKIENGEPLLENVDSFLENINSLIAKIENDQKAEPTTEPPAAAGAPVQPEADAPAAAPTQPEADAQPVPAVSHQEISADAQYPYGLHVFFDEGCGMENLRAFVLVNAVKNICADNEFRYEPEDVENHAEYCDYIIENGFLFRFRNAAARTASIAAIKASGSVRSYEVIDAAQAQATPSAQAAQAQPAAKKADAPAAAKTTSTPVGSGQHVKENLISVNLTKLDQLMAVVGEIVITESMVTASPDLNGLKLDQFTKSARQLRKLTDELQDVSMALRMVPVSGTFQKMNRIVRDMCKKLGKQAKLTLIGEDTEVDKTIVDSISDPIMHIVRNSMDHGIENTTEERVAAGKPAVGEIILSATHTGSEVIVEISDDGQGVDCDAVLAKAQRQGLANPDVTYSKRDILNFLLMPGFSTNTEITEYSGRGVGMDVVKKNVEDVGGTVVITSEQGEGMTTTLKIPLTMAIMDGMEVRAGNSIFTIPIVNIRQMMKISADDIIYDTQQGEMVKCMDHFYPVLRVCDVFSLPGGVENYEDGILMWVESGEISFCMFVDDLLGEQQVVVKPLPGFINGFNVKSHGIGGCTILGDGNISIILDVASLYANFQN